MSEAPKRERRLSTEPHEEFGLGHEAPVSDLVSVNRNGEEVWVHPDEVAQVLSDAKKSTSSDESGPSPDSKRTGPDIPAGKKPREAFLNGVREVGRNFGPGGHKVKDESVFRAALGKYADYRTRWGGAEAFAAAVNDLDVDDVKAFRERTTEFEKELADKNLSKPDAPETSMRSGPGEAPHATERMTEEELLKGLEGLSVPDGSPPAEYVRPRELPEGWDEKLVREKDGRLLRVATDGKNEAKRLATDEDRARLAWTLSDIKPEEIKAPAPLDAPKEPLQHEGAETEESDLAERQARISAESRRKKRDRRNARRARMEAGTAAKESAEDRDARLAALADDFDKKAGADNAIAMDLFQDIDATLSDEERNIFIEKVRGLGWKINGDVHQVPGALELIPLGNTAEKLTEALGAPAGKVDGIPFWILENGDGVMLSGGPQEGRYPQRYQDGGFSEIRGSLYEYKDRKFRKISEKEVAARRAAAIAENEQDKAASKEQIREKAKRERAQPEPERERVEPEARTAERPARREERADREGPEKSRKFEDGLKIFLKTYKKEKRNAGTAFREATKGLSDNNRKRLIDFLSDTTDIPRPILERIHRDVDDESERDENNEGEKRVAPVEREVDRMLSGRAQSRANERSESRESGNIDDEIDRMLGLK